MDAKIWRLLQLFAEGSAGEGAGGDGGQGTVAAAADDGQDYAGRLRALGVPERKIRQKRAETGAQTGGTAQQAAPERTEDGQAAAAEEEGQAPQSTRLSWEEIMRDPEYNREMQQVIQRRLRGSKQAKEQLDKLTPALELLAGQYGLDIHGDGFDVQTLADAVTGDAKYYEGKAAELGTTVETAMRVDRMERQAEAARRQAEQGLEQQRLQQHFLHLQQQAEQMRQLFPGFDLQAELDNPVFARMTSPEINLPVQDAYYAVHRQQLQQTAMEVAAQKTAQKMSNAIAAGQRQPVENGLGQQPATQAALDYRSMTKQQREMLKQQIRQAAARGEKLYPR